MRQIPVNDREAPHRGLGVAGAVTVVAMVAADYFIARYFLAEAMGGSLPLWIGFDVWRSMIGPENILFWSLGLLAALWTAASRNAR